ncbi:GNAT family N-acetyltransferase, partial [Streptomyces sp. NPDC021608]
MEIRTFGESDWPHIWPFMEQIIRKGDTFCYDPLQTEAQARVGWLAPPPGHVVVAVEGQHVIGTS